MTLYNRIKNIGLETRDDTLIKTRKQIINLIHAAVFISIMILLFVRLLRGEFYLASVNFGLLFLVGISFVICFKRLHNFAFFLILHYSIFLAGLSFYHELKVTGILYLSIVPIVAIFTLNHRSIRIYYMILSVLVYIGNNLDDWSNIIQYTSLTVPAFICCFFLNDLLERLHSALRASNIEKGKLLEKLKDQNKELILFNNMMGHDLKAPLRAIDGFSELLQQNLDTTKKEDKENLDYIIQGVADMNDLINNLLYHSKISNSELTFSEFNFEDQINSLISNFHFDIKKQNIQFIKNNLGLVYGDKNSLYHLFQNLISNSIKFQPIDQNHQPTIEISQIKNSEYNIIIVKDNGIGMKESDIKIIFKPFKRLHSSSKYNGTGLGMSIVNRIVEKHQGNIKVESEINVGSTFTISLPVKKHKELNPGT